MFQKLKYLFINNSCYSIRMDAQECYTLFQKLEKAVHGTKICEGKILQKLLFDAINSSQNLYTEVSHEKSINLNPTDPNHRKIHRVDIFCRSEPDKIIWAYNSKGKSFNNTESQELLLAEYLHYMEKIGDHIFS